MSETQGTPAPEARIVPERRWSWAWLVPIAIVGVLLALAVQASRERPIPITIRFEDGAGLMPGDPVACRGVRVGEVSAVRLSRDAKSVVVFIALSRDAAPVAVEGTRFWVVRPEVSLRGVSGLDALFGPRSIAAEPGPPDARRRIAFDGLERAPRLTPPSDGSLVLSLRAQRRGSLAPGSTVTYRDVEVGQVLHVALADDAAAVDVSVAIEPPYAPLVRANSRFYSTSGIRADWGLFSGLDVRADSLESVVAGGVGFATPNRPGDRVASGHTFDLAATPEDDWLRWAPEIPVREP